MADVCCYEAAKELNGVLARSGLILTIADNGCGMSPEARARLFEAFFTTKGIGGTGLGLWISAEIMERHQGRIRLRSCQDPDHRGTVVTLFLPVAPQEQAGIN